MILKQREIEVPLPEMVSLNRENEKDPLTRAQTRDLQTHFAKGQTVNDLNGPCCNYTSLPLEHRQH